MADIKKAIRKGWIANVREEDIMQNPLLARMVRSANTEKGEPPTPASLRSQWGQESKPVLDFLLRCPKCQHGQHVYVYEVTDKPWVKCDHCAELIPTDAWAVIAMSGKGSPIPAG
ncbi:hypothetical protein ES708_08761 [subsurface metagenome]